ncbi:hypothetical protein DFS34DRAFT_306708 [Phlyctochytrium arcticum]|nr:hypothetical protein DFS34DRAFT_306708 [Phlyctochytrium arcticum]
MGRTNPLALRLKGSLNWPGNVRHQFLSNYVRHAFQDFVVTEPHIRSSTTGIWINCVILPRQPTSSPSHPFIQKPVLDFRNASFVKEAEEKIQTLGRIQTRVDRVASAHKYFSPLFAGKATNFVTALDGLSEPLKALQIHRDVPIKLNVTVLSNPLLNADVCAAYIAENLSNGKPINKMYRQLLNSLSG